MDYEEKFEVGENVVYIVHDTDTGAGDPRDGDNLGIMLAEGHRRYTLGDKEFAKHIAEYDECADTLNRCLERNPQHAFALFERWLRACKGATVVLPLYLLDHSGITMHTGPFACDPGGWDSGIVGFIFDTKARRELLGVSGEYASEQNIRESLEEEVRYYAAYLEGSVFGYVVKKAAKCNLGFTHEETIDSCWGFIVADDEDMKYLRDEAKLAAGGD